MQEVTKLLSELEGRISEAELRIAYRSRDSIRHLQRNGIIRKSTERHYLQKLQEQLIAKKNRL